MGNENNQSEIRLWKDNRKNFVKSAGVSTSFLGETFGSGNFAPCGNDHFTHVNGKFVLYDKDKVMISVDSVTYSGEDQKATNYKNGKETDYMISRKADTIVLKKIK